MSVTDWQREPFVLKLSVRWIGTIGLLSLGCGATLGPVALRADTATTLHVGEMAVVHVASDRPFSLGFAGQALTFVKVEQRGSTTAYVYQAAAVGQDTIVATPREPGPDGCVSCVTVHYFVEVIR